MEWIIGFSLVLLFGFIWIGITALIWSKKGKDIAYMLFFTVFYIYLFNVLDYTLFQFQSLLLLKYFMPELMLNGVEAGKSVNLIPIITLGLEDLKTSFLNILLMVPFGFGLPFITNFRMRKAVILGLLFSFAIESLQAATGVWANMTFRIADINDVIFNACGVAIGYVLFVGFIRIVRRMPQEWKLSRNPIVQHVVNRPQK
jgi:glycopeptide antibiotics resistance protein